MMPEYPTDLNLTRLERVITSSEQVQCKTTWGFDPILECRYIGKLLHTKESPDDIQSHLLSLASIRDYCYESWFPLVDFSIKGLNLNIGARINFGLSSASGCEEQLLVRCDSIESPLECVHLETNNLIEISGRIPIWDRFGALRSIAAGIAELGIIGVLNIYSFLGIYDPENLPSSFNALFQRSFILAIRNVLAELHQGEGFEAIWSAFRAIDDVIEKLVFHLVKTSPPTWFIVRLPLLNMIFCASATESDIISDSFLQNISGYKEILSRTPEDQDAFRKQIETDPVWEEEEEENLDWDIERGPGYDADGSQRGQPERYGPPILRALLRDSTVFARLLAAPKSRFLKVLAVRWPETTSDVLALLSRDPDPRIQNAVARHPHAPVESF